MRRKQFTPRPSIDKGSGYQRPGGQTLLQLDPQTASPTVGKPAVELPGDQSSPPDPAQDRSMGHQDCGSTDSPTTVSFSVTLSHEGIRTLEELADGNRSGVVRKIAGAAVTVLQKGNPQPVEAILDAAAAYRRTHFAGADRTPRPETQLRGIFIYLPQPLALELERLTALRGMRPADFVRGIVWLASRREAEEAPNHD